MENKSKYLDFKDNGEVVIKEETLYRLNELRESAKKVNDELKELTSAVCMELRVVSSNKPIRVSDYNLVKKGGTWTYELDEETLKHDFPKVYDACLRPVKEKVSFSLVYAKREKKGKE